jgi:hypothetical protein
MSRAISYTRFDEALLKELEKIAESFREDTNLDGAKYKALKKRLGRKSVKSAGGKQEPSSRPAGSAEKA